MKIFANRNFCPILFLHQVSKCCHKIAKKNYYYFMVNGIIVSEFNFVKTSKRY